jgi:DNA-binding NtrC family response regulator
MFSAKKSTVLVIDNDQSVLRVFRRLLEKNGYQVATSETGKEAIQNLHCSGFDAALIDLELPDVEGTDLLSQLKKTAPEMVKIIFGDLPKLEKSIDGESCDEVLVKKPICPETLLTIIEAKLQKTKE